MLSSIYDLLIVKMIISSLTKLIIFSLIDVLQTKSFEENHHPAISYFQFGSPILKLLIHFRKFMISNRSRLQITISLVKGLTTKDEYFL